MTQPLDVSNEFAKTLLEGSNWTGTNVKTQDAAAGSVDESTEVVEVIADHTCPLCESALSDEISDERMLDHTNQVLEAVDAVAEVLAEAAEVYEFDDEDEDEE